MTTSDSQIIIVGAGIFGLSTSLWLARSGYKDVTVFDRCAFDNNFYDPSNGCDGASADINKVFRTSYADRQQYQNLAIEARQLWLEWNEAVARAEDLPPGMTAEDKLLLTCGCYFLAEGRTMSEHNDQSLKTMERHAPELRKRQFVKGHGQDEDRLRTIGAQWARKLHILDSINDGETNGFLDIEAGITIADKACVYARHLCERAGVKFVLGDTRGRMDNLIIEKRGAKQRATGIQTSDGKSHYADVVIVACGGWTASLIPEAHRSIETTAGTVAFVDVPRDRLDLWAKFHPDNCPVWVYRANQGGEFFEGYGFPITKQGRVKFGFRGTKFTNFADHPTEPNLRISTPRTAYSANPLKTVPLDGLTKLKAVVGQAFPELKELGLSDTKLCWYTDSIDNHWLIDYIPGYSDSLFICTGGSGHAFKFLPILGRHVKNQLERVADQFTPLWKWRVAEEGKANNGLSEGEAGPRVLTKVRMAQRSDLQFEKPVVSKL
ncbi:hypothetical protein CEP52_017639 [Fusarium oligoseptatum]|uniref:FAD dependent oxidoreductase domain-containing protein n=1 Tax=Fusarium oligoseptatum TaxID=2604345 RepID=A0A428RLD7_9HYPO|nr:hypothetical protein CEP52_017639 [Fusarium oligoseptatum]